MARKYNEGVAKANRARTKHGGAVNARQGGGDRLYKLWSSMKDRCHNPNNVRYPRYGGRGITVCDEWISSFEAFRDAVGVKPEGATLERIDNNKGYYPSNVRWATPKEQANNRVTNAVITHDGLTMTLSQWADYKGWKYGLILSRWKRGLRGADLLAPRKSKERNQPIKYMEVERSLAEWGKVLAINYQTLRWRFDQGLRGEELFKNKQTTGDSNDSGR